MIMVPIYACFGYIATDPGINEYYTPELEEYLTRFANMFEHGAF
jgi:hypothetical protein